MEENFFVKDCVSSDSASSAQLTHISNETKISTNSGLPTIHLNKFNIDNSLNEENPYKKTFNYLI